MHINEALQQMVKTETLEKKGVAIR